MHVIALFSFKINADIFIMNIHEDSYLSRTDVPRLMRRKFTTYAEDNYIVNMGSY
jgi:hypothetical protein